MQGNNQRMDPLPRWSIYFTLPELCLEMSSKDMYSRELRDGVLCLKDGGLDILATWLSDFMGCDRLPSLSPNPAI